MKKYLGILIGLMLLVVVAACSDSSTTSPSDSEGDKASKEVTIKAGLVVGDWSPHYEGLSAWKELLEEKSNGTINLEIYPDGQLGGEREMLEGIQQGSLESGVISSAVYSVFDERAAILDMPYLITNYDDAEKMMDGPVGDKIAEHFAEKGLKVLAWGHNDFRILSNNVRTIKKPEDLQGIKFRVPENKILMNWFESLGSLTTPMPTTDIYNALQQGVVDGQDNGPVITYAGKYVENQKFVTVSNHTYSPVAYFINLNFWNSLSEEQQSILEDTAKEAALVEREAIKKFDEVALTGMEEMGVEVTRLSEEEIEAFKESTKDVLKDVKATAGEEFVDMVIKEVGY